MISVTSSTVPGRRRRLRWFADTGPSGGGCCLPHSSCCRRSTHPASRSWQSRPKKPPSLPKDITCPDSSSKRDIQWDGHWLATTLKWQHHLLSTIVKPWWLLARTPGLGWVSFWRRDSSTPSPFPNWYLFELWGLSNAPSLSNVQFLISLKRY